MSLSPQEWQRLLARLEYLRLQHATLVDVAHIFSRIARIPVEDWIADPGIGEKLAEQQRMIEQNEPAFSRPLIGELGGQLYDSQERLQSFDRQIPVPQIRAYFQGKTVNRDEVCSLLRFLLSNLQLNDDDLDKIDYLTTRYFELHVPPGALSDSAGIQSLRDNYRQMLEYAGISTLISPDAEGLRNLEVFREEFASATSLQHLSAGETLHRLRRFKLGLKNRRLLPDVMVEMARVNLIAGECFRRLSEVEIHRVQGFVQLLKSAGVTSLDNPQFSTVDAALELALLEASKLNDDYRQSPERIAQLAQIFEVLERACQQHNLSFIEPAPARQPVQKPASEPVVTEPAAGMPEVISHDPTRTADAAPVQSEANVFKVENLNRIESPADAAQPAEEMPQQDELIEEVPPADWWRQVLRLRIRQIGHALRETGSLSAESDVNIQISHSSLLLHQWESQAFLSHHQTNNDAEINPASLLRVSIALMAELGEKQRLIDSLIANQRVPAHHSPGLMHLQKMSLETLKLLHQIQQQSTDSGETETARQFQRTSQKLHQAIENYSDCFLMSAA
jgi:hypothetical protein